MIGEWPILTIVTFVPLFGALFLLLIRGDDETVARNSRHVTIWVTGFTFLLPQAMHSLCENISWAEASSVKHSFASPSHSTCVKPNIILARIFNSFRTGVAAINQAFHSFSQLVKTMIF